MNACGDVLKAAPKQQDWSLIPFINSYMIKRMSIIPLLFFVACCGQVDSVRHVDGQSALYDLAIHNVSVFDSKNKLVLDKKTILINADTIASVIDASEKFEAQQTIDGKNRLVVPGFVDTHTHILQTYGVRESLTLDEPTREIIEDYKLLIARQYLRKGVTTIVDMGQPEGWINATVELQYNPSPTFPNVFINGSSTISDLSWDSNPPAHHEKVYSSDDARNKVRKYAELGIKHMKLYWKLEESDMKAVVEEARNFDITLNAHVDNNIVSIPEAMDLGVSNFEHFFTVIPSVLNFRETQPEIDEQFGISRASNIDEFAANMVFFFEYIKSKPELDAKLEILFDQMAANNVSISTALNVLASSAGKAYTFSTFDPFPARIAPLTNYTKSQQENLSRAFTTMMQYVLAAHNKGVKIRIGTDTRYGGDAYISEMMLLHEAGLSVEDVLQIATLNGAQAMKIDDRFGSVEPGKKADLVMFAASPFDDYQNLSKQKVIVKGGKVFEPHDAFAYELMQVIEDQGSKAANAWFHEHKDSQVYGSVNEAEMNEVGFQLLARGKTQEAVSVYRLKNETFPSPGKAFNGLSEGDANQLGYRLLQGGDLDTAIEVFKLNIENNPGSANAYDSMGEAYLDAGNNELALANYKKSVELDAENANAIQIINELEGREVFIDNATLDAYTGQYEPRPEVVWEIAREGTQLTFQESGQQKFSLVPISVSTFVIPRAGLSITFRKDQTDKISEIVLNQSGRKFEAKRIDN